MPEQPAAWTQQKYKMVYNQTQTEAYFPDAYGRVWFGLITAIESYNRDNASPDEARVLALFNGKALRTVNEGLRRAAAAVLDKRIEETTRELHRLQMERLAEL